MLYFTYGSNMDIEQAEERVGGFSVIGKAVLEGYSLRFNKVSKKDEYGRANIISENYSKVEGVLYDFAAEQFQVMDQCEGGYSRIKVTLSTEHEDVEAITYIANENRVDNTLRPSLEYLGLIEKGAKNFGLSDQYQKNLSLWRSQ